MSTNRPDVESTTFGTSTSTLYGTDHPGSFWQGNWQTSAAMSRLRWDQSNSRRLSSGSMKLILIASVCLLCLCTTLTLAAVLKRKDHRSTDVKGSTKGVKDGTFSFEDFINSRFSPKYFNGSWWSENEIQWSDKEGNLVAWNIQTGATSIIVSKEMLASLSKGAQFMGFSPDDTMILFAYDIESVWRQSFTARYLVLDTNTNKTKQILSKNGNDRLQYCDWVFNDADENILIMVSENDIHWMPDAVKDDVIVITDDGLVDNVFNGIPDWVYEEEVLGTNSAHYISPSGSKIAFAQFNDTLVPEFNYPNYGNPNDVLNAQYPTYKTVRYPKSGQTNPTVKLFVRQVSGNVNKYVVPPIEVQDWEEYIYTYVSWITEELVSVVWMNRIQNQAVYSTCKESQQNWDCSVTYTSQQQNGWLQPSAQVWFNGAGTEFLTVLSKETMVKNKDEQVLRHFPHLAKIDQDGKRVFLSGGEFVVTELLSWDEEENIVYFTGTSEKEPGKRHMYRTGRDGGSMVCLTCNLQGIDGTLCDYNDVDINNGNTHYVHICYGQGVPEVTVRKLSDGKIIQVIEDNKGLKERLENKIIPTKTFTFVEVDGNFAAPVMMILPPNMEDGQKYPMIVKVYGGPGSQLVKQRWSLSWEDYLAGSKDIVIAVIDGRGTGFQSDEYMFAVYKNLGTVEMVDQIEVTRQLAEANSFIDKTKIGIWGWSYGGFATAMTLEQDIGSDPVFSCGISVAPVTSWLLYDSVYTERYMALPVDNFEGYNNSVINRIEGLRDKKWMLNHGVADDNVHYQHSMLLTSAMERADIQFEQHSYPDENHSLGGVSRFLYHAMDDFWNRCFELSEK